jgi:transposase-like protein
MVRSCAARSQIALPVTTGIDQLDPLAASTSGSHSVSPPRRAPALASRVQYLAAQVHGRPPTRLRSEYVAIRSVAGRLGMNPETLRTWFRPVEVKSHQAEDAASPRPTAPAQRSGIDHRRMGKLARHPPECITSGASAVEHEPTTILRPTGHT